jgi:hypothetical protein
MRRVDGATDVLAFEVEPSVRLPRAWTPPERLVRCLAATVRGWWIAAWLRVLGLLGPVLVRHHGDMVVGGRVERILPGVEVPGIVRPGHVVIHDPDGRRSKVLLAAVDRVRRWRVECPSRVTRSM